MSEQTTWILTDTASNTYVESLVVDSKDRQDSGSTPWKIEKQRLKGGLRDGVDLIEIASGDLSVMICPTRGMGIWRGRQGDVELGWKAPIHGPVHPAFINRDELGGIGWLQGFDEWIVRCGLNNNGAPATDRLLDNTGAEQSMALPLHGRIANIPAHRVEVHVDPQPPYTIRVIGVVDESMLFFPQLRLTSEVRLIPGANSFSIHDRVTNLRSQPAELELLYHCNFGAPLLEKGSHFRAPLERVAPINELSARVMSTWDTFPAPTAGVIEQCYLMKLRGDATSGRTLALLENATGNRACAFRFSLSQLPYFTLWKNPGALSDGYVTGLEPGTDFPNAKPFERAQGRVVTLPPGASYDVELSVEIARSEKEVAALRKEIEALQRDGKPTLETEPPAEWAPR